MRAPRVALLGYGAIARAVRARLAEVPEAPAVVAALARTPPADADGLTVLADVDALVALRPDLVLEAASHEALARGVPALLEAGIDVAAVSIGALCDPATRARLEAAARAGGGRLLLVSGAIGGLDALSAAALGGLDRVAYVGRKPPAAWRGSPGAPEGPIEAPLVLYDGDAAGAARLYPKNANVAAAVALAGIGFERTRVRLVADPGVARNVHEIEAAGAAGALRVAIENDPLPGAPRTSALAAHSLARAALRRFAPIAI